MFLGFVWMAGAQNQSVIVSWDRNDSHTNLAAYSVRYGTASGLHTGRVDVATNFTRAAVVDLAAGYTYFFVVIARSVSGLESYPSSEVAFTIGNVAPVARNDEFGAIANRVRIVALDDLLINDDDNNGDPLTVVAFSTVTTNGSTLALSGTNLAYAPVQNYTGPDLFTYTVSDGRGGTATADVLITVRDANDPALHRVSRVTMTEWGVLLQVAGVPGLNYTIERSTDLRSWVGIAVVTVPPSGSIEFTDPNPPPTQAFYRAATP